MEGRGRPPGMGGGGGGWRGHYTGGQQPPGVMSGGHSPLMGQHPGVGVPSIAALQHLASSASCSTLSSRAGSAGSVGSSRMGSGSGTSPGGMGASSEGEVGCSDCAALYPITEDALLHNLTARHKRDQIYVSIIFIGSI